MKAQVKRLIRLFGEDVSVVGTEAELKTLVSQNVSQGIWLGWEVLLIKKMGDEQIKAIHQIKKRFPGAVIHAC